MNKYILICFFSFLPFIFPQFIKTTQSKVVKSADDNNGSENWKYPENFWNRGVDRLSENGKVFFCDYEAKCNLFVYEMLYKAGFELPLINKISKRCEFFHKNAPKGRPPTNQNIFNKEISGLILVGGGEEGKKKSIPGDIITNGHHMGIVMGEDSTISASANSIRYSDFNSYTDPGRGFFYRIFRYDNGVPVFTYSVKTKNHGILSEVSSNSYDYAGIRGDPIIGIAIKVDRCKVKYRVHVIGGGWLGYIYKYDWTDFTNGYAGNGKNIDLVEVNFIYCDLNPKTDLKLVPYRVSPLNKNYYDWQFGNKVGDGCDGYAGAKNKQIDRFQIRVT